MPKDTGPKENRNIWRGNKQKEERKKIVDNRSRIVMSPSQNQTSYLSVEKSFLKLSHIFTLGWVVLIFVLGSASQLFFPLVHSTLCLNNFSTFLFFTTHIHYIMIG